MAGLFGKKPGWFDVVGSALAHAETIGEAKDRLSLQDAQRRLAEEVARLTAGGAWDGVGPSSLPQDGRGMQGPSMDGSPIRAPSGYAGIGPGMDGSPLGAQRSQSALFGKRLDVSSLAPMAAEVLARGGDPSAFLKLVSGAQQQRDVDSYISTVPQGDQPMARMGPGEYAGYERDVRTPKFFSTPDGLAAVDPRTKGVELIRPNAPKPPNLGAGWEMGPDGKPRFLPGGPADPDYIRREAEARAAGGRSGAPPEWVGGGTDGRAPTSSTVVGGVLAKVAQGAPLSPGEQAIFDRYQNGTRGSGSAGDDFGYGYDDTPSAPAPRGAIGAPRTPPSQLPKRGQAPPPARPAGGTPPLARLRDGQVTNFSNGQSWTLRNGKAVRVQ